MAWSRSSEPSYTPLRQSSGDSLEKMAGRTPGYSNGDHTRRTSDSSYEYPNIDAESGVPLLSYVKLRSFGRRRRPLLLVTALGAVACFSVFIFSSYATLGRYLPERIKLLPSEEDDDLTPIEYTNNVTDDDSGHPLSWNPYNDGVRVLPNDATHVLVPTDTLRLAPVQLLRPMESRPPLDMLVDYYMTGALPTNPVHPTPPVDLVYLFVNATSPYFAEAKNAKSAEEGLPVIENVARRWRDNGELRGAVRSGALSLGKRARTIHLISAAFDFDVKGEEVAGLSLQEGAYQMGQIPDWLNWHNKSNIQWHFHPEMYRLPRDEDGTLAAGLEYDEREWQKKALPTFNSFEIESRVAWVHGLGENFIMSNDDMFMLRDMATSDFFHPLFGPVHRVDTTMTVDWDLPEKFLSFGGEWGGLRHAALLISQRFPQKLRGYTHHIPKSLTRTIVHEASVMFSSAMSEAATRAFRESRRGRADIEMAWLIIHFNIERWREALLWTWAVARVGGIDGVWGPKARDEVRRAFDREDLKGDDVVHVTRGPRTTVQDMLEASQQTGWENPANSRYLFSSFDGVLPTEKDVLWGNKPPSCNFDVSECLPEGFFDSNESFNAADMFKRIAFERPQCGDCLVHALVTRSGPRGLSAFLPSGDVVYFPPPRDRRQWDRPEPMLPLTPTWQEADFSLADNVRLRQDVWLGARGRDDAGVILRNWCVKLLSRYTFVSGSTNTRFVLVQNPGNMDKIVKDIDDNEAVSMLCINDDQPDGADNTVRNKFQSWMERMFGNVSQYVGWEKPDYPWE